MWLKTVFLCIFGCTHSLTTSFDLGGVMSGNRMAGVPLGRTLAKGEVDVEGICTATGMACQNCTLAVTCVPLPYGWLKVLLQECTDGFTCNAHEGTCTEKPVPECDVITQNYQHTCEQVGIFPDAYDCRKFHLCSPPEDLPDGRPADHRSALCPRHYGYNPLSAQCSVNLLRGQCTEKPVPDCTVVGQTDTLPSSPNHYYVCLLKQGELYPQVFICPHGWFFWGGFCRPEPPQYYGVNTRPDPKENPDTSEESRETDKKSNVIETENNQSESDYKRTNNEVTDAPYSNTEMADKKSTRPEKSSTRATTTRMESFFSTEKSTTYAADTFLADRFDLSNYESTDDVAPPIDEFNNSYENGGDFW